MISISKGILSNFASKTAVAALGLLTVILVSKYLGAEGRGVIGLFMSTVALVQLFCDFGNSTAIINLSYTHNNKNLWFSSVIWVAFICVLSVPLLLFFYNKPFVWLIPPAAFLYSIINLNHLILMGNRQVHFRNLSTLVFPAFLVLFFFMLSKLNGYHQKNYVIALFFALITNVVVSFILVKKHLHSSTGFQFESDIIKKGFWAQSAQAVQFLNYRLNFFLIGILITVKSDANVALGVYNNAVILCESIWILGHSIGQIQHMKILNSPNKQDHIALTIKMTNFNFFGSLALFLILIVLPSDFWIWLLGKDFWAIGRTFLILSLGTLSFAITNIISHALHAGNKFQYNLLCNFVGLITGLYVSYIYIPLWGLRGAFYSWSLGLFVSLITYVVVYIIDNKTLLNFKKTSILSITTVFGFVLTFYIQKINFLFALQHDAEIMCLRLSIALISSMILNVIARKIISWNETTI